MNSQSKNKAIISVVLTLIAVILHGYLANKFYGLKFGALEESSLCNINEVLNCDAVSASQYASFLGIPMAMWGAVTNLVFLFLQIVALLGWSADSRKLQIQTFMFSSFIALVSIVMGVISTFLIKQVCIFCIAAYALSWISFFLWWKITLPKEPGESSEAFISLFTSTKWVLVCLIAIPALGFLFNSMMTDRFGGREIESLVTDKYAQWTQNPEQQFTENGLVLDASPSTPKKMVIVEFADFLCPHCKMAKAPLHSFTQSHPDVKFIFKSYPLDGTCNTDPVFQGQGDGVRCRLTFATHCADKLFKKGWEVHDYIFDEQENLHSVSSKESVDQKICDKFGFNCAELTACITSTDTLKAVQAIALEGSNAKIQGTPTVFVNGRHLGQGQFLPVLRHVHQKIQGN